MSFRTASNLKTSPSGLKIFSCLNSLFKSISTDNLTIFSSVLHILILKSKYNQLKQRIIENGIFGGASINQWKVEEEILIRNEYLAAENEILKSKLKGRINFKDTERIRLAKIGKRIGLKALKDIACIVKPETLFVIMGSDQINYLL